MYSANLYASQNDSYWIVLSFITDGSIKFVSPVTKLWEEILNMHYLKASICRKFPTRDYFMNFSIFYYNYSGKNFIIEEHPTTPYSGNCCAKIHYLLLQPAEIVLLNSRGWVLKSLFLIRTLMLVLISRSCVMKSALSNSLFNDQNSTLCYVVLWFAYVNTAHSSLGLSVLS